MTNGWIPRDARSSKPPVLSVGTQRLKPLKESLPAEVTYEEIRLVVARLRRLEIQKKESASA